jgi:hypothetical protein
VPKYIIQNDTVLFRQSFSKDILQGLFVTLYALGVTIYETGSKRYPHSVRMSESEFLSCLELAKGE